MTAISEQQIADLLGLEAGLQQRSFTRLASPRDAGPDAIVFAVSEEAVHTALASAAGLILAPSGFSGSHDVRLVCVKDPKYAFALVGRWFDASKPAGIHQTASVAGSARLGKGVSIGAGSVVEAHTTLGEGCMVGSNVVIHEHVSLGRNCVVQSGTVLGSTGFGYARSPDGRYIRFPQQGSLRIGDDVEIGANCTIDRGALGETVIGRGTKIDNLVHIAHNCRIGEDVLIAAQVGIAGSTEIGNGAILAGQVGLAEHVKIGPGVVVGAQAGVPTSKRLSGVGQVFWGTPARPIKDYLKDLARLRLRR